MGRQLLPANGTQNKLKNVTNKMCIRTTINVQLKKNNRLVNVVKEINGLTALVPVDDCWFRFFVLHLFLSFICVRVSFYVFSVLSIFSLLSSRVPANLHNTDNSGSTNAFCGLHLNR